MLVHGTAEISVTTWLVLMPVLKYEGYCVFTLDYGGAGLGPIETSAAQLSALVDQISESTGSAKVSIVSHSQGSLVARYYMRFLGGGSKVQELVGLAPSNHGTSHPLLPIAGLLCYSCIQQGTGSAFLQTLNEGGDTEQGVDYTVVATKYDEIVIPYQSQFLDGDSSQVTNVTLQDQCPLDLTEHLLIQYSSTAIQWVINALEVDGPASPAFSPRC